MTASSVDQAALEERAGELLRSVGQRVTKPRVAVLACVLGAGPEHLGADELLAKLAEAGGDPAHRATVYRTLEGLTAAGVLSHVHLDRGLTAYHLAGGVADKAPPAHLHAQCTRCGRVVDLPTTVLGDTATRALDATGFTLDVSHVALSGVCSDCST